KTRTAALKRSTSNAPPSVLNFIKLSDARLQAVLSSKRYSEHGLVEFVRDVILQHVYSRKSYSEHGLVEFCRPVPLQVCHLWMVVSNCIPGSPQIWVPSAILRSSARASFRSQGEPSRTRRVHHSRSSIAAFMKSSL